MRQLPRTTAYLLLNLPVGLALFVATVTGVSVGIGLTGAFFVGIPLVVLTLLLVRRLGEVERTRARALLGAVVDDPPELPRTGHPVARVRALLGDDGTWRALAYALVALPWGVFTASMTLTLWVAGIGYSTFPVWWWATGGTADPGLGRPVTSTPGARSSRRRVVRRPTPSPSCATSSGASTRPCSATVASTPPCRR